MGFVADRRLEDLLDDEAPGRATRRICKAGTDRMLDNTRKNTPINRSRQRQEALDERSPGTLRDSLEATEPVPHQGAIGTGWKGTVHTFDPAAPNVEWDTRPHVIRARFAKALAFLDQETGDEVLARSVRHPGTRGQHMFAIGAAITEAEMDVIARPALMLFERELVPAHTGRVIDTRVR